MESKLDRSKSSLKVNKKLRSERTTHSLLIAKGILVIVPDCVKSLVWAAMEIIYYVMSFIKGVIKHLWTSARLRPKDSLHCVLIKLCLKKG